MSKAISGGTAQQPAFYLYDEKNKIDKASSQPAVEVPAVKVDYDQPNECTVLRGFGIRGLSVFSDENGHIRVVLEKNSPLHRLVFSGGGAKGYSYPGAISALEDVGALADIREVRGTSAGSILALAVATGMSADDITQEVFNLTSKVILGSKSARNSSLGASLLRIMTGGYVFSTYEKLENFLAEMAKKSVLKCINKFLDENMQIPDAVKDIHEKLNSPLGRVSFQDLAQLQDHGVRGVKRLVINTTSGKDGLRLYNSDSPGCREQDIARISATSSAITADRHDTNNKNEADGGYVLNMLSPRFMEPLMGYGNKMFEDTSISIRVGEPLINPLATRDATENFLAKNITGSKQNSYPVGYVNEKTIELMASNNIVNINSFVNGKDYSGFISGTLNFNMSEKIRQQLQANAYQNTLEYLSSRAQIKPEYHFSSMHEFLLNMPEELFTEVCSNEESCRDIGCELLDNVMELRLSARNAITEASKSLHVKNTHHNISVLKKLSHELDALLPSGNDSQKEQEKAQAIAQLLISQNDHSLAAALRTNQDNTNLGGTVVDIAIKHFKVIDLELEADRVIRDKIYPLIEKAVKKKNMSLLAELEKLKSVLSAPIDSPCILRIVKDQLINIQNTTKPKPTAQSLVQPYSQVQMNAAILAQLKA
ncbi:hypothetical protein GW590_03820 [Rahnella sp. SAP-1]|uniref:PNPLA domain-containing protein n=1 Tax=Rouxiella aceris TaxID=2703884 RepID=A0A848MFQ3_9GAMM|nr:patatin-like phospholipase family protein [Rouxiella aceris]NMP26001.1 hypothetical protein [Rouxiella aceris]